MSLIRVLVDCLLKMYFDASQIDILTISKFAATVHANLFY